MLGGLTGGQVGLLIGRPLPMRHGRREKKGRFSVVAVARLRLLLPEEHPRLHFQAGHVGHLIVHFIFFFFLLVFFIFFFSRVEGWTQSQIDGRIAPVVAAGLTAAAAAVPADEAVVTMTAPAAAAASAAAHVFVVVAGDSTDATLCALRCGDVIRLIGNITAAAAVGVP